MLDNCEHVLDEAAELMEMLEQSCPRAQILATSREGLGIDGERILAVPWLGSPSPEASLAAIADADAVRLFLERARGFGSELEMTAENAESIGQVCRRLDGVPLAIELAAGRLPAMNPRDLAARLDRRFQLLAGGRRGKVQRHQTLRAVIDWSYDLLSEAERRLYERVTVFSGGWTLDAAEEVPGRSGRGRRGVRGDGAARGPFAGGRRGPRVPDPVPAVRDHPRIRRGTPRGTRRNQGVSSPARGVLLRVCRTRVGQARGSATDRGRSPVQCRTREPARCDQLCDRLGRCRSRPRLVCAMPFALQQIGVELRPPAESAARLAGAAEHPLYPRCLAFAGFQEAQEVTDRERKGSGGSARAAERLGDPDGLVDDRAAAGTPVNLAFAAGTPQRPPTGRGGRGRARGRGRFDALAGVLAAAATYRAMAGDPDRARALASEGLTVARSSERQRFSP